MQALPKRGSTACIPRWSITGARKRAKAGAGVQRIQGPTLPVRLRGRIEDKGCDRQVIGTPGLTCEGMHHRGILEHLLQGVLPCVSKARSLLIVGAGQSPGEGIGNGRATTLRFAQEGARILAVDRLIASAEETAAMATQGGECVPFAADVTKEETLAAAMEAARARWGRIDILHNNVGVSIGGGDKPLDELSEEAFDRVCAINLRGTIMACKHVLPIMRLQRSGAIINISSVAARENSYPLVTYKATKAAMIAFTEQLALQNAPYCIRANCILPGLMDTPMAVDTRARASNRSRAEVAAERDAKVRLRGRMGTAWGRAEAKENANRCRTCRTQCRESVSPTPERVRKAEASRQTSEVGAYAGKLPVRFCAGCALQARRTQLPEMAAAAKPSEQPRTESCVASGLMPW